MQTWYKHHTTWDQTPPMQGNLKAHDSDQSHYLGNLGGCQDTVLATCNQGYIALQGESEGETMEVFILAINFNIILNVSLLKGESFIPKSKMYKQGNLDIPS